MTDHDRETRTVTDDVPGHVYVERRGGALPWILAALVAILAIVAIFMLMNRRPAATNADDIAAAVDAGRAAGFAEGVSQIPPATTAVPIPVPVPDTSGVERSAAAAADAAEDARQAAERAADSVAADTNTTP